ncbi:SRPBCC family protein [Micromonospora sp. DT81.3]|uniref:SRPBCC family protein n=1 Tax=Micromonospora sp. DT81.3 TaxID=3416523 RepID=UPI003CF2B67F
MTETQIQREISIRRHFDAPPSAVFRAWTDPDHLGWFLNPEQPRPEQPIEVDLRVGGAWRVPMVIDDQTAYTTGGIYLELERDRRIVFAWGAVDGWPELDPEDLGAGPVGTVELVDAGGGTDATFSLTLPDHLSEAAAQRWLDLGIREGWTMTIARLHL